MSTLALDDPEAGVDTSTTQVFQAAESQQAQNVISLLGQHKADPNSAHRGWTALHQAACTGSVSVTLALLCANASVNARSDKIGWTPLHYAARFGHRKVARLLFTHRSIDPCPVDWTGKTPLDHAIDTPFVVPVTIASDTSALNGGSNERSTDTIAREHGRGTEILGNEQVRQLFPEWLLASLPAPPSTATKQSPFECDTAWCLEQDVRLPVYTTIAGVLETIRLAGQRSVQRSTEDTAGYAELCRPGVANPEPQIWNARLITQDIQVFMPTSCRCRIVHYSLSKSPDPCGDGKK